MLRIEHFRPEHAGRLADLPERCGWAGDPADTFEPRALFDWPYPTFVAFDGGGLVGYVEGRLEWPVERPTRGTTGAGRVWVDHVFVDPSRRRERIGAALMHSLVAEAHGHGFEDVACLVDGSQGRAGRLAFFGALGMTPPSQRVPGGAVCGLVPDVLGRAAALLRAP